MATLDIYARISDDRTGQAAGVQRQINEASALVERRGHTVGETHVDNDISASSHSRKARPGYTALLARVESGVTDGIAAFHTDRLYRRPRELEDLIELVEKRGLLVATCEGDFDLGSSDGRMVARVLVTMAAKESDDKSRRIRSKHVELAAAGKPSGGGHRPFGYQADRLTLREDEASLIRQATADVLSGASLRSITMGWRAAGVPTVTGARWETTTVKRLLCSARIAGKREYKGTEVPAVWPAIVTVDQSRRLRLLLSNPDRHLGRDVAPFRYLLTGIVYCGRCEVPMTTEPIHRKGIKYRRYSCRTDRGGCNANGITADRLEEDIGEMLDGLLANRRGVTLAGGSDEQKLIDAIEADDTELKTWARDYANHNVGRLTYLAAANELEARINGLRSQLRRVQMRVVVDGIGDEPWADLDFDRRRRVAERYIAKITVRPTTRANNRYDPTRWLDGIEWR